MNGIYFGGNFDCSDWLAMWNQCILPNVKLCNNLKQVYICGEIEGIEVSPIVTSQVNQQGCQSTQETSQGTYRVHNYLAPLSKLDNLIGVECESIVEAPILVQFLENKAYLGNLHKMKQINIMVDYSDKEKDCYPKIAKLLNQTQVNHCIGFDSKTSIKHVNQCLSNLAMLKNLKCRFFETRNKNIDVNDVSCAIFDASILESLSNHCKSIEYFEGCFHIDKIYHCAEMVRQFSNIFTNCKSLTHCQLYFDSTTDRRNVILLYKSLETAQRALKKRFPFELYISQEKINSTQLLSIRMRFWKNIHRQLKLKHLNNKSNTNTNANTNANTKQGYISDIDELNDQMCHLTLDSMKNNSHR